MVAEQHDEPQDQPDRDDPVIYIACELLPLAWEACGEGAHARWLRRLLIAEADRRCAAWGLE